MADEADRGTAALAGDANEALTVRVTRLEAQVRTLQERVAEFGANERTRKQRALIFRLGLLALLLALYFVVQFLKARA